MVAPWSAVPRRCLRKGLFLHRECRNLDVVRQHLRQLGLYGLLAQAQTLLQEPWLARVIDIEDAERARRSLKRRLDDTRLGAFKPLADFDWNWPERCDRALVEELFSLNFVEEAANVVLVGPNGLGKWP